MLYRHVSKESVIAEYAESSRQAESFAKVKWGSPQGMLNRYRLGLSVIDWAGVRRWLDLGCGTAEFFRVAEGAGHRFAEMVGVDITPQMLAEARGVVYYSPARFVAADVETLPAELADFDLLTLVGLLQQCGAPPRRVLSACLGRLRDGGQIFITTKNLQWEEFTSGRLQPDPAHSWFVYDDLAAILVDGGIKLVRGGGFLPRSAETVPLEQAHSMFILGRKQG